MRPVFITSAASVAALLVVAGPAWGQANRTFVSGHGADSNPCSLSAPCRSFSQALTQTNAGGEITVLDPAGYGSVIINKSVSIVNDGVGEAGVTVTGFFDAIDVTVGANDVVNLRGLTLVGGGVGNAGILFNNLGALNVQNCVIRGFINPGLIVQPEGNAEVNVSDTIVSNLGGGISVVTFGSGTVSATFNRVQSLDSGGDGFFINGGNSTGTLNVTIANSSASSNGNVGILAESATGQALTQVMVVHSVASNNGTGLMDQNANSFTYLAGNTIAGNGLAYGVSNGGAMFSFGDNDIKSNGNDGGALSSATTK